MSANISNESSAWENVIVCLSMTKRRYCPDTHTPNTHKTKSAYKTLTLTHTINTQHNSPQVVRSARDEKVVSICGNAVEGSCGLHLQADAVSAVDDYDETARSLSNGSGCEVLVMRRPISAMWYVVCVWCGVVCLRCSELYVCVV